MNGFLDKNKDFLYRDLSQAMYSCDHPLLKTLFPEGTKKHINYIIQANDDDDDDARAYLLKLAYAFFLFLLNSNSV